MTRRHDLNRRRMRAAKEFWVRRTKRERNRSMQEWIEVLADAVNRNAVATVMAEKAGLVDVREYAGPAGMNALANGEIGQYNGYHRSSSPP